ncbi:SDR family NAD(P)-dependent oxidoreductase [Priestia megaterium]|uniref:SDR family NAD(P)-dependent oxidoreductase n=1 Tax=Priestia megaterium TaxID=1404 RepID=UPI0021CCAEB1|nr:SDR family NAD(P)-dependent oxidoreductase [Priestia megaterium]
MLTPVWDPVTYNRGEALVPKNILMVGGTHQQLQVVQQYFPNARVLEFQLGETIEEVINRLKVYGTIDHILWIVPECNVKDMNEEALINEQNNGVLHTFRMIKALNHLGYDSQNIGWTVLTVQTQPIHKYETVNPIHASLHGLIGSMAKEYPNWKIRLVDLEANASWPIDDLFTLPPDPKGNAWVYRGRQWYRQQLIPLECPPSDQTMYKLGGVYVVIGGAGGIGEVWSEYMIRTYQAQIVWIGRRKKDANIQAKIDRLSKLGPSPYYVSADATDPLALQRAYDEIKKIYMKIHGVIHSAIVLEDCSLMNMEEEQFKVGLAAKVDVSVRIAQIFKDEPLDFVMIFSSVNSFFKAAGQSNYVSGCTFTDVFAHQLALEWPCAVKVMNWGYWGNVGVVASEKYQARMKQSGIGSIEPSEAMEALEALLAGPMDQISLMKINK